MKAFLLAAMLAFFFLLINSSKADLITNGGFSTVAVTNVSICRYNAGFFGFGATCYLNDRNFSIGYNQPANWSFNNNFDAVRTTGFGGRTHLFMYTISKGDQFYGVSGGNPPTLQNGVCGYTAPVIQTCSGTDTGVGRGGNISFNPTISQNFTIPNTSFILSFEYKNPFTLDLSQANQVTGEQADTPDQFYYNCYNIFNFGSSSPSTRNCTLSSNFRVQLTRVSDGLKIIDMALSGSDNWQAISFPLTDLNIPITNQNYNLTFTTVGTWEVNSANGIQLANIQFLQTGATTNSQIALGFINQHETLTSILRSSIQQNSNVGSVIFTCNMCYSRISSNFSDFYKFDFNFTWGINLPNGFFINSNPDEISLFLTGFDSSGNNYSMTRQGIKNLDQGNSNIGVKNTQPTGMTTCNGGFVSNDTAEVFGYLPSNITKIMLNFTSDTRQGPDGGGCGAGGTQNFVINVTLDSSTISSRKNWILPINLGNGQEIWNYGYPLLIYGFAYNSVTKNITFQAYNFRNSTSFYPSLNQSEGVGTNNVYLYRNGIIQAADSDTRTYFQEYTNDFTNIIFNNAGIIGDTILLNRTSAIAWYNSTSLLDQSQWQVNLNTGSSCSQDNQCVNTTHRTNIIHDTNGLCSVQYVPDSTCGSAFVPPPSAAGGGGGCTTFLCLPSFTDLITTSGAAGWSIGFKLVFWTSVSLASTFIILYGVHKSPIQDFSIFATVLGIIFMIGTFFPVGSPFVPIWFWGFILLALLYQFGKGRVFGESDKS